MAVRKFIDETGLALLNTLLRNKFDTKADLSSVPTKTSDLINDSGFGDVTTKVSKSGDTMTGNLTISSGGLSVTSGYIYGEGNSNTNHAIKLGHNADDIVKFFEYGGIYEFYKSVSGTNTLLGKINSSGWVGSAALSGTPTAPTARSSTNNTQIANTAFVKTETATKQTKITYSTTDLTAGSSDLATGEFYAVYE